MYIYIYTYMCMLLRVWARMCCHVCGGAGDNGRKNLPAPGVHHSPHLRLGACGHPGGLSQASAPVPYRYVCIPVAGIGTRPISVPDRLCPIRPSQSVSYPLCLCLSVSSCAAFTLMCSSGPRLHYRLLTLCPGAY